jgi:uncharacterized membrane protein YedE/YeeE
LGGFCPGPGLVAAASGLLPALVFVVGMIVGMKGEHLLADGKFFGADRKDRPGEAVFPSEPTR